MLLPNRVYGTFFHFSLDILYPESPLIHLNEEPLFDDYESLESTMNSTGKLGVTSMATMIAILLESFCWLLERIDVVVRTVYLLHFYVAINYANICGTNTVAYLGLLMHTNIWEYFKCSYPS